MGSTLNKMKGYLNADSDKPFNSNTALSLFTNESIPRTQGGGWV